MNDPRIEVSNQDTRIPRAAKQVVANFVRTARENGLVGVKTVEDLPGIGVWLKDGTDVPALAIGQDELGNWVMVRRDNLAVVQFFADEVS